MSEDASQDRSPNAPPISLEDAIGRLKQLQPDIGRSQVTAATAAKALGYAGLTGSSLTLLAALSQYGLLARSKGMIAVTPLSLRILHPTSQSQLEDAIREAALAPKVLADLYNGYNECSEDVLTSHLVQNRFSLDRAKRVARVFTANRAFAKLQEAGHAVVVTETEPEKDLQPPPGQSDTPLEGYLRSLRPTPQPISKMLAQYQIPLGGNEATLVFTGKSLVPEDFDALIDYVGLFKRQFERKQRASEQRPESTSPPSQEGAA